MGFQSLWRIGTHLGYQDVKQINRRSKLGQWWITLGTALLIGTMGAVFGLIFKIELHTYLPYLACGLVFWGLFSGQVMESSTALINSDALMKQLPLSPWVFLVKTTTKTMAIFAHNSVIIPFILVFTGNPIPATAFLLLLAMPIIVLFLTALGMIVAIFSLRYRDFPPMVSSLLNVVFYLTPVMWLADSIQEGLAHVLLGLNPVYHFVQIFRLPILGGFPTFENWTVSLSTAFVTAILAMVLVRKFKSKLVYWL